MRQFENFGSDLLTSSEKKKKISDFQLMSLIYTDLDDRVG